MRPDLSEFSYGFALTQELIGTLPAGLSAAPVFPSLIDEGREGGGYDLLLDYQGVLLFLQFKLSHEMTRATAKEWGKFGQPYFRMHLRSRRYSKQHELLLGLENGQNLVLYSAPAFRRREAFDDAYFKNEVAQRSVFVRPSAIGPLTDDDEHYVAFRLQGDAYFCSQPRAIAPLWLKDLHVTLERHIDHAPSITSQLQRSHALMSILLSEAWSPDSEERDARAVFRALDDGIDGVASLAAAGFESALVVVYRTPE